jgi:hypothetical protein
MAGDHDFRIAGDDWADWDQAGRLVFTRSGKVWSGRWMDNDLKCKLLIDLNDRRPSRVFSPKMGNELDRRGTVDSKLASRRGLYRFCTRCLL